MYGSPTAACFTSTKARKSCCECTSVTHVGWNLQSFLLSFSEAKFCHREKRIAFVGDSRIRQLFYSFIKMMNPEVKEVGNKVCCWYSFQ